MRFASFVSFCAVLAAIGIALGTWQITRLQEKQTLLNNISERLKQPPIKLDLSTAKNLPPFTPIEISGNFTAAPQEVFLLLNRVQDGTVGRGLMRILHTPEGAVPVDIGWVAQDYQVDKAEAQAVTITGIIRKAPKKGFFTPENNPQKQLWYYINLAEISQAANIASIGTGGTPNFYISTRSDFWRQIPNNHLQYALTWYSLSAIFLLLPLLARRYFADKRNT